ncbi:hypothetical protein [Rhizobium tropici]|uniref:Uncharacterized protein n=2 Tax=Rhizobium TaxID=379 RepID=A0A1C3XBF2_9HYPH|nr:hypothetical protein [Rhizobium tropici]AGB73485.1 hypothetical protein RTCIAT899_PB01050 [Rhizobium tropici CIAT 899]MBB6304903.1 hypothetical protein [Rhizobium leucaenae]MBB6488228.1 hypothetical protein [Rhizobium lusitanum]MBB4244863.1 hypothetical protein [Rhizobium tropici]MBB5596250.1 hypothetical protein [Rhizobium tropici]
MKVYAGVIFEKAASGGLVDTSSPSFLQKHWSKLPARKRLPRPVTF